MSINPTERIGDLVLPQGTYVLVQDGSNGQVDVIVGPNKTAMQETDKPVIYDPQTRRFNRVGNALEAVQSFSTANEGQYIVLHNPSNTSKEHPGKGRNNDTVELNIGNKINLTGPKSFALFPGQFAEIIDGHQLKSNEYLVVRVYNEDSAKANFDKAIVKAAEGTEKKKAAISEKDLINGKLLIIKGTEVSFYIPPTGIEVVKDGNNYVRKAVTLERLEYCILLDQNGNKRYVKGPDVVFPEPTEEFIGQNGNNKFRALELNDNMGIYIKVIADYTEGDNEHKAGDEMFITGKTQKIYYPQPEHALVKYGDQIIHFAIAIPAGEGRYILNKETGAVEMVKGPKMFLPDPRKEVVVKRILDDKTVELYFPGNDEALAYNQELQGMMESMSIETDDISRSFSNSGRYFSSNNLTSNNRSTAQLGEVLDLGDQMSFAAMDYGAAAGPSGSNGPSGISELQRSKSTKSASLKRSTKYTKPRTITLDTKYEGVVSMNVWPGYAIQVIKKNGEREVVYGPKVVLLEYDETLEVLELSTGKPKSDSKLMRTVYLQTNNNIVSDLIEVETKDSVNVSIRLSYRVNFKEDESNKWFSVSNYVKLLTQHLRSVVRNSVKKHTIEDFNNSATDIIRNTILGESKEGKRDGKTFDENGMNVYDVEVLNITIGDANISKMLKESQYNTVEKNLSIAKEEKNLEYVKKIESFNREKIQEQSLTEKQRSLALLETIAASAKAELERLQNEEEQQKTLNKINDETLSREKKAKEQVLHYMSKEADVEIKKVKERMSAVTPGLIEALTSLGTISLSEVLAKNLRAQTSGLHGIFPEGGMDGLLGSVKGTVLEKQLTEILSKQKAPQSNG